NDPSQSVNFSVKLQIFLSYSGPGIVLTHSISLKVRPNTGLSIKVNRFAYFFKHSGRHIRSKLEPGSGFFLKVKAFDGVLQATGGADYRNRAVPHTVHLVQTAGLVKRRHQKHIGAGLDLMCQGFSGIAFEDSNPVWRSIVPTLEKLLIFPGPG